MPSQQTTEPVPVQWFPAPWKLQARRPYATWDHERDIWPELSEAEVAEEMSGPFPQLVYFGPIHRRTIKAAAPVLHDGATGYVYLLMDRAYRELYVGKSKQPATRIFDHKKRDWFQDVRWVQILVCSEYDALERWMIEGVDSIHNVALRPRWML